MITTATVPTVKQALITAIATLTLVRSLSISACCIICKDGRVTYLWPVIWTRNIILITRTCLLRCRGRRWLCPCPRRKGRAEQFLTFAKLDGSVSERLVAAWSRACNKTPGAYRWPFLHTGGHLTLHENLMPAFHIIDGDTLFWGRWCQRSSVGKERKRQNRCNG